MSPRPTTIALTSAAALALALVTAVPASSVPAVSAHPSSSASSRVTVAYDHLRLPSGEWAKVYSDGIADVHKGSSTEIQHLPLFNPDGATCPVGDGTLQLPAVGDIISDLVHGHGAPYAAQQVVVIYRAGVTAPGSFSTSASALRAAGHQTPAYTSDKTLNTTLAKLGVDKASQLFSGAMYQRIVALHTAAVKAEGHSVLDYTHAYVLHLTAASVPTAVEQLRSSDAIAYAAPNWTVTTAHTPPVPVTDAALKQALADAQHSRTSTQDAQAKASGVPTNYTLTSSGQALLNRPGVDAVPAYSQIAEQSGQLPGQGETITNVSLGTIDDASAAANPNDPCNFYANAYGPTTEIINGQRYIDWPSMPLIPTYTADATGALDPTGETCGDDPTLTEVGLDFSMMAPLPDGAQRPGHEGSGLTDLLGIAPGANYRLVLPATAGGAVSDVDAAFLGAALQNPRPDVISASLEFGYDADGFSGRFLEDDPMTEAILSSIVHAYHIVVSVAAGDGLRTSTNAPVSPAGGAVATDIAKPGSAITDLNDIGFSDAVSRDYDSGSIDAGGSTLDDIFSAPPQDPRNKALQSIHAYPAVRYDGARNYSSGFGSRVDVAAPGDNVLSFTHVQGGDATAVQVVDEGGTSASAPEVAAAAAIVLQVARLTHQQKLANNPLAVRDFLAQTGATMPAVKQADRSIAVGPQVDVGNAVRTLYGNSGAQAPGAPRVAVEQRQQASSLGGTISTVTDPTNLSMVGRLGYAWITISPDWVGLPASGVTYRLAATEGPAKKLASTPWARLQPTTILAAAGLSLVSAQPQTVSLAYSASAGGKVLAKKKFSLTFGPTDGTTPGVLAPIVSPVVSGSTIKVSYDITNLTGAVDPTLVVSQPGRVDPSTGLYFRPAFTAPLTDPTGTVDVPVSSLQGGGIYGIGIQNAPGGWFEANDSAYAFTRVAPTPTDQPAPPTLSADGSSPGHFLEIPYNGSFQLHYDVRNVPGATGAMAEFSAPGPNVLNNYATFNNPSGSERDNNGHDTGSVAFIPLTGTHGVATLNSASLGLVATMNHLVRVLPLHGGAAAGEASGVSSLMMDGVRPDDGGTLSAGLGVNENGTDGFITSNQTTADGDSLGSVEVFNQGTAGITSTPASSGDSYTTVEDGCAGIFADDVGLYDDFNPSNDTDTYQVLDPTATGTKAGTWNPPASLGQLICSAHNEGSANTAILGVANGTQLVVATSNIDKGTFSKTLSLAPGLQGVSLPSVCGFAQNSKTGVAVVAVEDASNPSGAPRIVVVNFKTGKVTGFDGVTLGFPDGSAIDSQSGLAAVGSTEGFGIYDLGSQTGTLVKPGGSSYEHPAADPVHGQFLIQEVAPPEFSTETPDNNETSSVLVTDETGNVLQRIPGFDFFNIFLSNDGDYVQVNPATQTAFTLGPAGLQLRPFGY